MTKLTSEQLINLSRRAFETFSREMGNISSVTGEVTPSFDHQSTKTRVTWAKVVQFLFEEFEGRFTDSDDEGSKPPPCGVR